MENKLPMEKLRYHCRNIILGKGKGNYRSRIEIFLPDELFFQILRQSENVMDPYAITYIEIARDRSFITKESAALASNKYLETV